MNRSSLRRREACLRGETPAEALTTRDREHVVTVLLNRGWSVRRIAAHCRMTEYTTLRIRDRLAVRSTQKDAA